MDVRRRRDRVSAGPPENWLHLAGRNRGGAGRDGVPRPDRVISQRKALVCPEAEGRDWVLRPVPKVLPVAAVSFADAEKAEQAVARFAERAGPVLVRSMTYDFSRFTDYYEEEMGPRLSKFFVAFGHLILPDELPDLKLYAISIEDAYRREGKRQVNFDPGYVEFSKVVLATTKNYDHRVYLGKGIYADVQLRFRQGRFQLNDWTYPDYKSDLALQFFREARQRYVELEKASRAVWRAEEASESL
jgi:hypothetical protein